MPLLDAARAELVDACAEVQRRGLVGPLASGNASVSVDGQLLVTASATTFAETTPDQLVLVDATSGDIAPSSAHSPTTELALHLAAHRVAASAVRVVLHLHAPWMVAASCLRVDELPLLHYHQALLGSCATPVVPYSTPGSPELADAVGDALGSGAQAVLMANHGAVVVGVSGNDAVELAEVLEDICRLTVLTSSRARELTDADLEAARALFGAYGR
ncbi:MAG: class II aldolase/adducin family protein [Gaiellaceae bacterium]